MLDWQTEKARLVVQDNWAEDVILKGLRQYGGGGVVGVIVPQSKVAKS